MFRMIATALCRQKMGNHLSDRQASSQRLACFIETPARFRPDLLVLAQLNAVKGDGDFLPLGTLSREWLAV
jgi:hypothetical protein